MSCSALKKLSALQEELSLHDISIGENESKNILQELQKANTNFYLAHDVILKAKGSELGITPHQKGLVNKFIKAVANGQEPTQKQYDAIDMIRDLRELITKEDSKKKDPKPKVKENSKELLGTYMYTDTNGELQIKDGKSMIKITPEVTLFDVLNTT